MSDFSGSENDVASRDVHPSKFAEFIAKHNRAYQSIIWTVVAASIVGGTIAWLGGWLDVQDAGYWGSFLVNLVGSAAVVIPVPGLAAVCAGATGGLELNFVGLALAGAAGSTIGEVTGYLAGYGSQGVAQKSRYYSRIQNWVVRRGGFALFILAVVPNPLFDIGGFAAGSLGYPISKFFLWVGLGKAIKFLIVAYACRQSISWLADLV
ncbi:MAG TPA: DedA family protein [Dehalococcoidia bacterium]|nr:DedA family protein [Dehalococcoidia bacterium]HIK90175.1 DedA family protein [Dehalococcoidia bacterium]